MKLHVSSVSIYRDGEDWKRIRSAISKQVIPRRVGNLTPVLCDVTDDLLAYLEEVISKKNGRIDDITPLVTMWAFQSTYTTRSTCSSPSIITTFSYIQTPHILCLERT